LIKFVKMAKQLPNGQITYKYPHIKIKKKSGKIIKFTRLWNIDGKNTSCEITAGSSSQLDRLKQLLVMGALI